jgi:DNA recombination protein RmuC
VRGRWGELHLRRTVELAGMVDRCDFTEQTRLDDGARRPDLVVHLAGDRHVVVDAKVPLDAYLDATITALFAGWPSTPPPGYAQRDRELALAARS